MALHQGAAGFPKSGGRKNAGGVDSIRFAPPRPELPNRKGNRGTEAAPTFPTPSIGIERRWRRVPPLLPPDLGNWGP